MRIVAVEMSASKGSVALVDQGEVRASFSWEEKRENRQQLFDALKALAIEWSSVDQFVVGRGPGAFSGEACRNGRRRRRTRAASQQRQEA